MVNGGTSIPKPLLLNGKREFVEKPGPVEISIGWETVSFGNKLPLINEDIYGVVS